MLFLRQDIVVSVIVETNSYLVCLSLQSILLSDQWVVFVCFCSSFCMYFVCVCMLFGCICVCDGGGISWMSLKRHQCVEQRVQQYRSVPRETSQRA